MTSDWQLRRVSDDVVDDDIQSLTLTDTFNRFARIAEVTLDDPISDTVAEYPRGTLVELEVAVEGFFEFSRRFAGFVADYEQDRNQTSLTILSHDFWIRKRTVNRSFEGTRLETILETLIEDLTPLTYTSANIDLQDNPEISREWRGEQLEVVLDEIGEISGGNEDYGATNDLEFFMQTREFTSSPRNFGEGEYTNVEWSQDGKRDVNRAIVEYGEDDSAGVQIREDAQSQLDLQDKIGADDPVVIEQRKAYPEITDPDVAADKAKQLLNDKATLLTGEIETWEGFAVTPGSVTDVVDPDTGTDGEFVTAEITYQWPAEDPETEVIVADRSVATSEELINLSDDVTRVDLRDTDSTAPVEQNIPTRIGALVDPTVTIGGVEASRVRFTNTARNLIRDGWRGQGNPDIAEIAVGDDNSGLSRTNTALENETNRTAVDETLDGDTAVEYDADIGDEDTREVGLFDDSGDLLVRATYAESPLSDDAEEVETLTVDEDTTHTVDEGDTETYDRIEVAGTLETPGTLQAAATVIDTVVRLEVANDTDIELGVLTETGQESIRDILADNSPELPQFYAYGSGDTQPQETDTALETELARQDLDEIVVQSANTTADWADVSTVASNFPVQAQDGRLEQVQTTQFSLATEPNRGESTTVTGELPEFVDEEFERLRTGGEFVEYDFTFEHDVNAEDIGFAYRADARSGDELATFDVSINGTTVKSSFQIDGLDIPPRWFGFNDADVEAGGGLSDIPAGETITLRFEWVSGDSLALDLITVFDNRYHDFGSWQDSLDANSECPDPPLFSESVQADIEAVSRRRDVTEANISSSWNDTSNSQYLDLAIIDDDFERTDNSETASISVSENDADTSIQSRVGLSHFGSRSSPTPTENFNGQEITEWELTANPDSITSSGIGRAETRSVFPSGGDLSGTVLQEAGQLTSDGTCLSRSIFSPIPDSGTLPDTSTIISSEVLETKQS